MNKRKQYKEIEKALEQKYKANRENEAVLTDEDFKDGKLSISGYHSLKQQCDYISFIEDIEIKIPQKYEPGFKDTLENMAANELYRIKKDRFYANVTSLILLFAGIIFIILGNYLEFLKGSFFQTVVVIVSWVFIWAAVEKWFFERRDLREKRWGLLQILSAKIIIQ